MKKLGKHSDHHFVKGFGLWFLFDKITKMNSFSELLDARYADEEEKERIFKIVKILSLSVINESYLIYEMDRKFKTCSEEEIERIRKEILNKVKINQDLRGADADSRAEELLNDQTSNTNELIIPPVLQYLAGYSMGGLIRFARRNFSMEEDVLEKMDGFKNERDYIMHNAVSSRHDIDERIELGLALGERVYNVLKKKN